jgi:hypothetical protein
MLKFLVLDLRSLSKAPWNLTLQSFTTRLKLLAMPAERGREIVQLEDGWHEIKARFIDPVAAYIVADTNELVVGISAVSAGILVINMCTQEAPDRFSMQLRERYTQPLLAPW